VRGGGFTHFDRLLKRGLRDPQSARTETRKGKISRGGKKREVFQSEVRLVEATGGV